MYQSCPSFQLCIVTLLISANTCIEVAISLVAGKELNLRKMDFILRLNMNSETLLYIDLYIYL